MSSASAQEIQFDISDAETTSDDGKLDGLSLSTDITAEFDGLEGPATTAYLVFSVKNPDGSWYDFTIGQEETGSRFYVDVQEDGEGVYAGTASWSLENLNVLNSGWSRSDFAATEDGGSNSTTLTFKAYVNLLEAVENNQNKQRGSFNETTKTTVTVNNEPRSGSVGGDGSMTATGENQEN